MRFNIGDIVRRTGRRITGSVPGAKPWSIVPGDVGEVIGHIGDMMHVNYAGVPPSALLDPELFELECAATVSPGVRSNDPATSKAAASSVKSSKVGIKATILDLLDKHKSGLTGEELADYTGYRLNSVTPRFAELGREESRRVALIKDSGIRRNRQIVWVLK